ncbi:SDR family NAD(P)-dependent oxidoreductase [Promicromonospora sp. NPDC059942]|uniref:SDR family NAD(P)-dependent oxidoreductase n=1 Tax=Promicromonospora sp. NPDC059942 TaxID=3347009 RepID=UPI00365BD81D
MSIQTDATPVEAGSSDDATLLDEVVERLRAMPADDPVRLRAERVAESFARDGRVQRRRGRRDEGRRADRLALAGTATGAVERRQDAPLGVPSGATATLSRSRRCYVCKDLYQDLDDFYHQLCPTCADLNQERRHARTDLRGRRALITGGRVKIGFQLALMMLRDGAEVLVTTRFPADTLRRFRAVPGSGEWLDRLAVVAVDLRDPRQILAMCDELLDGEPLDILVNNAAQTLRRPAGSYAALVSGERVRAPGRILRAPGFSTAAAIETSPGAQLTALAAGGADLVEAAASPSGTVDEAGLLPDLAPANSWTASLGDLDPAEVLEVQLVNAVAPALLCDRLLPALLAAPVERRYVVNVTAVEGRFAVRNKTDRHPHTNMAKAALNMLTRTSGPALAAQGVYMTAVDTGWITDENPLPTRDRLADRGFRTPLDVIDGAARVYDPIVRGEAGEPLAGVFLKDYKEASW